MSGKNRTANLAHYEENKRVEKIFFDEIKPLINQELSKKREWRSPKHKQWKETVFKQGDNKCRTCGSQEKLEAHHIFQWQGNTDLRYEPDNGIVLCRPCHMKWHAIKCKEKNDSRNYAGSTLRKIVEEIKTVGTTVP